MLDGLGYIKIADFGYSMAVPADGLIDVTDCTKKYAPPEVINYKGPYNAYKSDIYMMGVVFYTALTCRYPDRNYWDARWIGCEGFS